MDELRELYIEPTSHCNLRCAMCSRSRWENESEGHMDPALFDRLMEKIPDGVTRIFFGGVGEPLYHPDILYMLRRAKETGRSVEMITNGTLLGREMSEKIVGAKLDKLWLSLDSMEEGSYEDIRFGASFNGVMDNLRAFNEIRFHPYRHSPLDKAKVKLGVAFVLMRDNLDQFKNLLTRTQTLGIAEIKAMHLLPYDESQLPRACYERVRGMGMYSAPEATSARVDIPFMDTLDLQESGLLPFISDTFLSFSVMGNPLKIKRNYCRFVQEGVAFVRWDGEVSPCMALLHENTVYQQNKKRYVRPCGFGNINGHGLAEIWASESYSAFRRRVVNFVFSPCADCGTCGFFESNEEDCFGNTFPVCGACLWAQGLFQCP